jgi:PAS domain S-box-containing protein
MPSPQVLLDLLADSVVVIDRHGRLLYCNDSAELLLGFAREELLGSYMIEHVLPDDRGDTLNAVWRVMKGNGAVVFDNRWCHKDGHEVPIQWSSRWVPRHQVRVAVGRARS